VRDQLDELQAVFGDARQELVDVAARVDQGGLAGLLAPDE
jgi:hypothetical protein